jgi:hypothetical protein
MESNEFGGSEPYYYPPPFLVASLYQPLQMHTLILKHHFINTEMYQQCSLRTALWGLKHVRVTYSVNKVVLMCVFVRSYSQGKTRLPLDGFSWNMVLEYFSKIRREYWSSVKTWQKKNWPCTLRRTRTYSSDELLPRLTGRTTAAVIKSIIMKLSSIHVFR